MSETTRPLNPPDVPAVRYSKNFIKTAVCELRFPALLELEAKPPHAFQKQIRKAYPNYEPQVIELSSGENALRENRYLFKTIDKHWTVSVKSVSLSLETSKYVDFEDFFERLMTVLKSAEPLVDADFFTRVGLRYINKIPLDDGQVEGWIRPELISPFTNEVLGNLTRYASVVTGSLAKDNGNYSMRHGIGDDDQTTVATGSKMEYTLDFDYYCENVKATAVADRLKDFHRTNFALFSWCLGPKARKVLGEGKPK